MRKFLTYLHSTIKLHWMLLAIFIYSAALVAGNLLIIQPQVREYAALKKQRGSLDEIYLKIRTTDVQNVLALLQKTWRPAPPWPPNSNSGASRPVTCPACSMNSIVPP